MFKFILNKIKNFFNLKKMILTSSKRKNYHKIKKNLGKEYFTSYCSNNRKVESSSFSPKSSFSSGQTIKSKRHIITPQNEKVQKIFSEIKNSNTTIEKNYNYENRINNYFNLNTIPTTNFFMKLKKKIVSNTNTTKSKSVTKNFDNNIKNSIRKNTKRFTFLDKNPIKAIKISNPKIYHKRNKTQYKTDWTNSLFINYEKGSKNKKLSNLVNKNYRTIEHCNKSLNKRKNLIKNKDRRNKIRQKLRNKISNEIKNNSKIRSEKYINLFNMINKTFNEIKKLIDSVDEKNIIIKDISDSLNMQFGDSLNLNMTSLFEDSINLNFSIRKKLFNNCTNTTINNDFSFEEEKQNIILKAFKVNNNAFLKNKINKSKVKGKIDIKNNDNNKYAKKINVDNTDNNKICNIF